MLGTYLTVFGSSDGATASRHGQAALLGLGSTLGIAVQAAAAGPLPAAGRRSASGRDSTSATPAWATPSASAPGRSGSSSPTSSPTSSSSASASRQPSRVRPWHGRGGLGRVRDRLPGQPGAARHRHGLLGDRPHPDAVCPGGRPLIRRVRPTARHAPSASSWPSLRRSPWRPPFSGRPPIQAVAFGGVRANAHAIGWTVAAFGPAMVFFAIHYMMLRGFYAMENTRTPFLIQLAVAVTNVAAALDADVAGQPAERVGRAGPRLRRSPISLARPCPATLLPGATVFGPEMRLFLVRLAIACIGAALVMVAVLTGAARVRRPGRHACPRARAGGPRRPGRRRDLPAAGPGGRPHRAGLCRERPSSPAADAFVPPGAI